MAHVHGEFRLPADADRFVHRGEQVAALAADMARVDAALGRRGARQRHDLLGSAVDPGYVDEPGREPYRALGDGVADERRHAVEVVLRRCPRPQTEHLLADGAVTDQRGDVHRRVGGVDRLQVVGPRAPRRGSVVGGIGVGEPNRFVPRRERPRRRSAIPHHDGRHPLADRARHLRQDHRREVRMVVDVHEARRHHGPGCIQRPDRVRRLAVPSDHLDAVGGGADPGREGRRTGPVHDGGVRHHEVEHDRNPTDSVGGQEHVERRPTALALLDPRLAAVELREPANQR